MLKLGSTWDETPEVYITDIQEGKTRDALHGVVSAAVEDSSHARSSRTQSDNTLLVRFPHRTCFSEGFTTFSSGPGPAIVNQSFPLPFNFSSRCNYFNALKFEATLEDHSEATAATHCGFPLARIAHHRRYVTTTLSTHCTDLHLSCSKLHSSRLAESQGSSHLCASLLRLEKQGLDPHKT